jgi:hypothetical protein
MSVEFFLQVRESFDSDRMLEMIVMVHGECESLP